MEKAAPKKPSFKIPTFAVPAKKAETSNGQTDKQENTKDTENVVISSPTPGGDNAPTVEEARETGSAPADTSSDKNLNKGPEMGNITKIKKASKQFGVKSVIPKPSIGSLKKVKDEKTDEKKKKLKKEKTEVSKNSVPVTKDKVQGDKINEEKKNKPKKVKAEVSKDSETVSKDKPTDPEKKKPTKRKLEKEKSEKTDAIKNKSELEEPKALETQSVDAADKNGEEDLNETTTERVTKEELNETTEVEKKSEEELNETTETEKKSEEELNETTETEKKSEEESNQTTVTEGKPEETTSPKEKVKRKEETQTKMPVCSYTDEEYADLFTAAIETAMNLDLDKWEPRASKPAKVKVLVKKKYSKTVGKKPMPSCAAPEEVKQQPEAETAETDDQSHQAGEAPEEVKNNTVGHADESEDEAILEDDKHEEDNEGLNEDVIENEEGQAEDVDENQDVEERPEAQQKNEATPDPSEHAPSICASPPAKKKKLYTVKKRDTFEPKSLSFSDKAETSMLDKVQQLKKIKKEIRREKEAKKRKLEEKENGAKKQQDSGKKDNMSGCKPAKKTQSKKKQMLEREVETDGTWVQCCNSTCMKWRHLQDESDPSQIPERWTCNMNPCEAHNSCDKEEEKYDESEHIYTKYTEGSVVLAKMAGFPWWPAMVEQDPDTDTYFSVDTEESMIPTHYHVVFFDERVSRSWVRAAHIKAYIGNDTDEGVPVIKRNKKGSHSQSKDLGVAKKNASRALSCNIKTRIELFGFATRYSGSWGKTDSGETSTSKGTHKPKKQKKKRAQAPPAVELLDDSTMDEVMGNTEAILDNVEEMLESLDDSDMDSDFEPEELVVVEKKKKKSTLRGKVESDCKTKKRQQMIYDFSDSESKNDEVEEEIVLAVYVEDENKSETDKSDPEKKDLFKFDSDVFTMEMDASDDEATKPSISKEAEVNKEPNDKIKTDVLEIHDAKHSENSEDEEVDIESDTAVESEKQADSSDLCYKSETDNKPSSGSDDENNTSLEQTPEDNKKSTSNEIVCDDNSVTDCKQSPDIKKSASKERDSDDDSMIDCQQNVNEATVVDKSADSDSEDEFDLFGETDGEVPQVNEARNEGSQQQFSMDDDSDNDFDQEEQFMYDSVVDGSQKSQERVIVPVPLAIYSEDGSNPFDIMEE